MYGDYKSLKVELFDNPVDQDRNYLPYDGIVNYHGKILNQVEADAYFERLLNDIQWRHDEAVIFGKRIVTKRKVAWYGERDFDYTYSNTTKQALRWTKELLDLKEKIEEACGETFNSCLLNLYHSGDEGMAWHSDAEKELKEDGAIGSVSLGAPRKFSFKHKTNNEEKVSLLLEHGSLLVMKGTTQTNWLHSLPKSKRVTKSRINLTFRTIMT